MLKRSNKPISFPSECLLFFAGNLSALLLWGVYSLLNTSYPTTFISNNSICVNDTQHVEATQHDVNLGTDPLNTTFYDDRNLSYSIDTPMKNWDEKRKQWLQQHPELAVGVKSRVLMLTGSQPWACKNPIGDHLLLRFFKNKVDYCRIHGYDLFYNNALLHPKMPAYWAKLPVVRSAMIAHPEAEWIWWVDSDAAFTDMEFKIPLERYKKHNFVVNGWPAAIYKWKSWIGLNAGIFLIRNCQWSMNFMDSWAQKGPQTKNFAKWGKIMKSTLSDKTYADSDDQSALVYLMLKEKKKWVKKIYLENDYALHGYWEHIVGKYENFTNKYVEIDKGVPKLRRRHAEKLGEWYGELREQYTKDAGNLKRSFVTHFTGCSPCSGMSNPIYGDTCLNGMERALNFADNQVLRRFGYIRSDLLDRDTVTPIPFDYPA